MSHPFENPKGQEFLRRVAQFFESGHVYVSRDSNIVFVCGGPMDSNHMRPRFCQYAAKDLPQLRIFLAENAQTDFVSHEDPEFHNIADFEEIIAQIAACVVLFPESPGSFAELGFFSKSELICKNLLVVNDHNLQGEDSFIALGPINIIDRVSLYRPTIQLDFSSNPNFDLVKQRIEKRIPGKRRKKFLYKEHGQLSYKEKFFLLFEIVRLFRHLTLDGVLYAYRSVFHNVNPTEIKQILSILVAAKYLERRDRDENEFHANLDVKSFLEVEDRSYETLPLEVLDFYQTTSRPLVLDAAEGPE